MVLQAPAADSPVGETFWRSLGYFGYYRLAVASVFLVMALFYSGNLGLAAGERRFFIAVNAVYWCAALGFVLANRRPPLGFDALLTLQVLVDIAALTLMLHASGGQKSGLAIMLLIALAGAGLVGQGRLVMFYAAMGSLALLTEEIVSERSGGGDGGLAQAGILSIALFATAASARFLAQRILASETLALQRGIALVNQMRVNERIIRDMHDGVLVVERSGRIRQSNPGAHSLLAAPELTGTMLDAWLPSLAEELARFDGPETEREVALRFAPGGRSLNARLVGAGGDVLVFLEDASRQQAVAQQLKLAALGRLTASIAHEIRNPLSAITQAADLMREEKRAETQARLTRIVYDNALRMERMVREVLELGRRDRTEPEQIDIAAFLARFLEEFCMHEKSRTELFRVDIDQDASLVFDRAHFNQVLWNLLGNALRYCSGVPGAVSLAVRVAPAANRCELHITDDGAGIPEALRGQVFEPFFTTHSQGTGLGLYIARELCEANGATLTLADGGGGANFCITGRQKK
jgi:two-component system sensor histidine kinase PilS (NtrC family)